MTWPLVTPNDPGIRPAGLPDACFYCRAQVGEPHLVDCVIVNKRVRLLVTLVVEVDVPHSWSQEEIEFSYNESSRCAGNTLDAIIEARDITDGCLCGILDHAFLGVVDDTPCTHERLLTLSPQ